MIRSTLRERFLVVCQIAWLEVERQGETQRSGLPRRTRRTQRTRNGRRSGTGDRRDRSRKAGVWRSPPSPSSLRVLCVLRALRGCAPCRGFAGPAGGCCTRKEPRPLRLTLSGQTAVSSYRYGSPKDQRRDNQFREKKVARSRHWCSPAGRSTTTRGAGRRSGRRSPRSRSQFEVTAVEDDLDQLVRALPGHELLVFYYTIGEITDAQKNALLGWVASGKGYVGIHSAADSFRGCPEYRAMVGGHFVTHPRYRDYQVSVADAGAPGHRRPGRIHGPGRAIHPRLRSARPRAGGGAAPGPGDAGGLDEAVGRRPASSTSPWATTRPPAATKRSDCCSSAARCGRRPVRQGVRDEG